MGGIKWTNEEIATLKKNWTKCTAKEIASLLPKRTITSVLRKGSHLNLPSKIPTYDLEGKVEKDFTIWLAGFVDGEGSIGISRRSQGNCYRVFCHITSTEKKLLEEIRNAFGFGTLKVKAHKPHPSHYGRKVCYSLDFGKEQAKVVLRLLHPYLKIKRRQAELVMSFPSQRHVRIKGKFGGRITDWKTKKIQEEMYLESRKLNSGYRTV